MADTTLSGALANGAAPSYVAGVALGALQGDKWVGGERNVSGADPTYPFSSTTHAYSSPNTHHPLYGSHSRDDLAWLSHGSGTFQPRPGVEAPQTPLSGPLHASLAQPLASSAHPPPAAGTGSRNVRDQSSLSQSLFFSTQANASSFLNGAPSQAPASSMTSLASLYQGQTRDTTSLSSPPQLSSPQNDARYLPNASHPLQPSRQPLSSPTDHWPLVASASAPALSTSTAHPNIKHSHSCSDEGSTAFPPQSHRHTQLQRLSLSSLAFTNSTANMSTASLPSLYDGSEYLPHQPQSQQHQQPQQSFRPSPYQSFEIHPSLSHLQPSFSFDPKQPILEHSPPQYAPLRQPSSFYSQSHHPQSSWSQSTSQQQQQKQQQQQQQQQMSALFAPTTVTTTSTTAHSGPTTTFQSALAASSSSSLLPVTTSISDLPSVTPSATAFDRTSGASATASAHPTNTTNSNKSTLSNSLHPSPSLILHHERPRSLISGNDDTTPHSTTNTTTQQSQAALPIPSPSSPSSTSSAAVQLLTKSNNNIGCVSKDALWEQRFSELKEFVAEHGHANVPHRHVENKRLGEWVHSQRVLYKFNKLRQSRIDLLEGVGFRWRMRTHVALLWEQRFDELVEYKRRFDSCSVPYAWQENKHLGRWVSTQRQLQRAGRLDATREERLRALDFSWVVGHGGQRNSEHTATTTTRLLSKNDTTTTSSSSVGTASGAAHDDDYSGPAAAAGRRRRVLLRRNSTPTTHDDAADDSRFLANGDAEYESDATDDDDSEPHLKRRRLNDF